MFQTDYMLNEAKKFAELLARLMGLKTDGKYEEYTTKFDDILQAEYNLELEKLIDLPEEEFKNNLESSGYTTEKLNALSQMLYVFAHPFKENEDTKLLLKKVLIIFDLLEKTHHYQSFENIEKSNIIYKYLTTHA